MFVDIYVLSSRRTADAIENFRRIFLSGFVESASEHAYPLHSKNPILVYKNAWEIINQLLNELRQPYPLYWDNNEDGEIRFAMLFFTDDAKIIIGLTIDVESDLPNKYLDYLAQMREVCNGCFGYVAYGVPPPLNSQDFISIARNAGTPKLFNGLLLQ